MATKKVIVASVLKGQDGKPNYLKVDNDVVLKKGQFLNMQTTKQERESLEANISNGKIKADMGKILLEKLEKRPDFVLANIYFLDKTE